MTELRATDLLARYKSFLIDAYGVLVTSAGALPGAAAFIDELDRRGLPYLILTNDASRLPETAAAFYVRSGVKIPVERVLTAGLTIGPALGPTAQRCLVLGTADTRAYVERAGHRVLDLTTAEDSEFDAVIVGDDSGFDFLPTLNAVLTGIHRQMRAGRRPRLLLANADLIYPRSNHAYGFTSGSIAKLLEAALKQLHPDAALEFEVIGKPSVSYFETALARGGFKREETVMLGDQLHTDSRGARAARIDCALIAPDPAALPREIPPADQPTCIVRTLAL